jgi:hypothetical protein
LNGSTPTACSLHLERCPASTRSRPSWLKRYVTLSLVSPDACCLEAASNASHTPWHTCARVAAHPTDDGSGSSDVPPRSRFSRCRADTLSTRCSSHVFHPRLRARALYSRITERFSRLPNSCFGRLSAFYCRQPITLLHGKGSLAHSCRAPISSARARLALGTRFRTPWRVRARSIRLVSVGCQPTQRTEHSAAPPGCRPPASSADCVPLTLG